MRARRLSDRISGVPSGFGLGMQRIIPLAFSVAAYGLVWGALAGQAGLTPLEPAR